MTIPIYYLDLCDHDFLKYFLDHKRDYFRGYANIGGISKKHPVEIIVGQAETIPTSVLRSWKQVQRTIQFYY